MNVLLICGSTRAASTNAAALRTAAALAPDGVRTTTYAGLKELPAFDPDDDREGAPLPHRVTELRASIAVCDAVLFCTPEYAGALPGGFKNLLDWTVGGGELAGKPVGWVNVASVAAPSGGADAHEELARVLGYVGARVVEGACRRVPVSRADVVGDGTIGLPELREAVRDVLVAFRGV